MKCIILVGGSGERLWPVSRDLYPKHLLKLYGNKTLLQNTFELAMSVAALKNIYTITNVRQTVDTKLQIQDLCKNPTIISEPMSKNTAPAIASVLTFLKKEKDDIVVILPVDFSIEDKEAFIDVINKAKNIAKNDYIVAVGIKPVYAESGYGYIKTGEKIKQGRKIESFIEKPSCESIQEYLKDENFFWNCGIYVSKISVLMNAFKEFMPEIINNMKTSMFDENNKIDYEIYEKMPSISIDYAIMEKVSNMAFVELNTNWHDYGSWLAVYNNENKDSKGNVVHGNVLLDKVKNSFVYSSKELVAVSGMQNAVVIETEDAVLVCDKSKAANINDIVKELKKKNDETTLVHKTVFRPWGFYTCLNRGKGWLSKIITVLPGHKLSLQSHNFRSEHWIVLEGTAFILLNGEKHSLSSGKSINIPVKAKHSLQNHTKEPLKILEVQKGDYISEEDIIRYEDMYGRIK